MIIDYSIIKNYYIYECNLIYNKILKFKIIYNIM